MGFRATLTFRKFKVALNPMYRIFLNFAKSCVLLCLPNVNNIKKFHRAVLRLVFTSDGVVVGVVIRSVDRCDLVKIKPTESEADRCICL